MAYEKISEQNKRQEKVNQLKDKIRKEIAERRKTEWHFLTMNYEMMNLSCDIIQESQKNIILTLTALYAIESYVNSDNFFMSYHSYYKDADVIIYNIPIDKIDLLLDEDFDFVDRLLIKLDAINPDNKVGYYFVGEWCNDNIIAHSLISIFDELEYERKIEIKNGDNS